MVDADLVKRVIPASETWKFVEAQPYFDQRVVVDVSAHFVSSSFHYRYPRPEAVSQFTAKEKKTQPPAFMSPGNFLDKRCAELPAAMTSHAHRYAGSERLVMELVPRAAALAEELRQTVAPLCAAPWLCEGGEGGDDGMPSLPREGSKKKGSKEVKPNDMLAAAVDLEVSRFLKARLVTCDLPSLMLHDCFTECGDTTLLNKRKLKADQNNIFRKSQAAGEQRRTSTWVSLDMINKDQPRPTQSPSPTVQSARSSVRKSTADRNGSAWTRQLSLSESYRLEQLPSAKIVGKEADEEDDEHLENEDPAFRKAWLREEQSRDAGLSLSRFELRFWRIFANGLARAIFGAEREDLVAAFEVSADEVLIRYEGELQLALNSLFDWLPDWICGSLFVAFVGQCPSNASQRPEKYAWLRDCLQALVRASSCYTFVSTPAWYFPLVPFLPPAVPPEQMRRDTQKLSLRPLWIPACAGAHDVREAVDTIWGGRVPGQHGPLALSAGVEPLGVWVLRMTQGFEGLLSIAIAIIREEVEKLEANLNDKLMVRALGRLRVADDDDPNILEEVAYKLLHVGDLAKKRLSCANFNFRCQAPRMDSWSRDTLDRILDGDASTESPTSPRRSPCRSRASILKRRSVVQPVSVQAEKRKSAIVWGDEKSQLASLRRRSSDAMQVGSRRRYSILPPPRAENIQLRNAEKSFLEWLHADPNGLNSQNDVEGALKLRRFVWTGQGADAVSWPLGDGQFGGRIPIHDSPELLPTAAPPLAVLSQEAHVWASEDAHRKGSVGSSRVSLALGSPRRARCQAKVQALFEETSVERGRDRTSSCPAIVRHPPVKENVVELDFSQIGVAKRRRKGPKPRSSSAPPAVDASDFDFGDPILNSVINTAMKMRIDEGLKGFCGVEGPLRRLWRSACDWEDQRELWRLQLSFGVTMLFAVLRMPLPTRSEMSLSTFVATSGIRSQQMELPPPLKIFLPDGLALQGCAPLLHVDATDSSARVSPHAATSFHVAVPQAFLMEARFRNVLLVNRRQLSQEIVEKTWCLGSLVTFLLAAAMREGQATNDVWHRKNGWRWNDYCSFYPLLCVFRFVFGLELVQMWHDEMPSATRTTMEMFFPFVRNSVARCRHLTVRLSMTVPVEAPLRPVLVAPWISPSMPEQENYELDDLPQSDDWPKKHLWPGKNNTPISLQDFAAWVCIQPPSRIIYSSRFSPTGDIYLRLSGAIVVFAFMDPKAPTSSADVARLHAEAIGSREWWLVDLISLVVMPTSFDAALQRRFERDGHGGCLVLAEGEALEESPALPRVQEAGNDSSSHLKKVDPGCEIVVCSPLCTEAFLGTSRKYTLLFSRQLGPQLAEQVAYERAFFAKDSKPPPPQQRTRHHAVGECRSVGSARRAAAERRRSAAATNRPKPFPGNHLLQNLELLETLYAHVSTQVGLLLTTCEAVKVLEQDRVNQGQKPWLAEKESKWDEAVALLEKESIKKAIKRSADSFIVEEGDEEVMPRVVKIVRVKSPERTSARRFWRPWTPHRRLFGEKKAVFLPPPLLKMKEPTVPFDFLGVDQDAVTPWRIVRRKEARSETGNSIRIDV